MVMPVLEGYYLLSLVVIWYCRVLIDFFWVFVKYMKIPRNPKKAPIERAIVGLVPGKRPQI